MNISKLWKKWKKYPCILTQQKSNTGHDDHKGNKADAHFSSKNGRSCSTHTLSSPVTWTHRHIHQCVGGERRWTWVRYSNGDGELPLVYIYHRLQHRMGFCIHRTESRHGSFKIMKIMKDFKKRLLSRTIVQWQKELTGIALESLFAFSCICIQYTWVFHYKLKKWFPPIF